MNLYDYISKNKDVLDKGYREGVVNTSTMFQYKLAKEYKELDPKIGKMTRYQWVADNNNVHFNTVKNAVKKMGV